MYNMTETTSCLVAIHSVLLRKPGLLWVAMFPAEIFCSHLPLQHSSHMTLFVQGEVNLYAGHFSESFAFLV